MTTKWNEIWGDEWERVCRHRDSYRTAEERETFWEGVCERKMADPSFRFEHLFPKDHLPEVEPPKASNEVVRKACGEILAMIARPKQTHLDPYAGRERNAFERELGEKIDLGFHRMPGVGHVCPWPKKEGA